VAQTPRIDLQRRALTLPACTRRELPPEESRAVAEWLEVLGGKNHAILLDWLALATDLARPVPALVMVGFKGGGKSLLAQGLSRIWTEHGPTKLEHAMGQFDSAIEHCPIVFGDERLPKDFQGRVRTEDIREFVQQTARRVDAKYLQPYTLTGAVRVVIAGNDASLLETKEHLTNQAVAAIAERFFFVKVSEAAEEHLVGIGGRAYIDPHWIQRDMLAKHILWLVETRKPEWLGRFGIEHDSTEVATRLSLRNGLRSVLCEWLVKYLLRRASINLSPESQARIVVGDDGVAVHVQAVLDNWSTIFRDDRTPATTAASVALGELAKEKIEADGEWLHLIGIDTLCAWAEETGFCTGKKLREAAKNENAREASSNIG
jgi:hypothetical protein